MAYLDLEATGLQNIELARKQIQREGRVKLRMIRKWFTSNTSIGVLYINGLKYCYTLEDVARASTEEKIWGETAIPYGDYPLKMTTSGIAYRWNTPGSILPLLADVPGYEGIRIHPGNEKGHTAGCILPGFSRTTDRIGKSTAAFWPLFNLLSDCKKEGLDMSFSVSNLQRMGAIYTAIGLGIAGFFLPCGIF